MRCNTASVATFNWLGINMQVSSASDYRLRDQALCDVLAMPGLLNTDAQRNQVQQGVMLVGPGSHDALAAMWAQTVGSLQTQVCPPAVVLTLIPSQRPPICTSLMFLGQVLVCEVGCPVALICRL